MELWEVTGEEVEGDSCMHSLPLLGRLLGSALQAGHCHVAANMPAKLGNIPILSLSLSLSLSSDYLACIYLFIYCAPLPYPPALYLPCLALGTFCLFVVTPCCC